MDTLPFPLSNQLVVVVATHAARSRMFDLAAQLALRGALRILDAGNQCNVYPIAQRLRHCGADVNAALQRIQVQRAFTCYQVEALLAEAQPAPNATLVLDLLATFYDQDVRLADAVYLLRGCLTRLQNIATHAPVLVSARLPTAACAERMPLLAMLRESAAYYWEAEVGHSPSASPPTLPHLSAPATPASRPGRKKNTGGG